MKTILNRIALAFLMTSLAGISVFAKSTTETADFPTNVKVNGTLVKRGVYDLKFDDKTGELSILKGNKIIARTTVSLEKRESKSRRFVLRFSGSGDDTQLAGVTFEGAEQDLLIGGSQATR